MRHSLDILDQNLGEGDATLTSHEVRERLGISAQSASNLLARWRRQGLVERVGNGRYAIRQLGLLGTRAVSEDPALAVAALVGGRLHRIAYHSALDFHGLLVRPARTIQIATPHALSVGQWGGMPPRIVYESAQTVGIGAQEAGHGARVSTVERTLLDAGLRPDLVGGYLPLAEALSASTPGGGRLRELARRLGAHAGLRRVGSIAEQLGYEALAEELRLGTEPRFDLDLDPGLKHFGSKFRDRRWRVRWPVEPERVAEEIAT